MVNKALMEKDGFVSADTREIKPRIIMAVEGLDKDGKTHFSLTAPPPIAMFSLDIGDEGVVEKFKDSKEIWLREGTRMTEEDDQDEVEKEWDAFYTAYNRVIKNRDIRSVILDTETEVWELLRLAKFGRLSEVMPYMYGPVNKIMRKMIRDAYDQAKNLILLRKLKDEYVNDKRTGGYKGAGFNDVPYLVQVNARVYRYAKEDGGDFAIFIKNCRQNPDLAEEEFVGEMCNFPFAAQMVLPDVDPKHWE